MKRLKNTKERGIMEFLYYRKSDKFIGVCLTFDIVEEGDDLIALKQSIEEAAKLHLRVVCKKNLSDDLLNRYAPTKYWKKYFEILRQIIRQGMEKQKMESDVATLSYPTTFVSLGINCPSYS